MREKLPRPGSPQTGPENAGTRAGTERDFLRGMWRELGGAPERAVHNVCKRCGRYIDLKDYHIDHAVSKNFKTHGVFVIEPAGYVFNTEAAVGEAVIKGRFLGKLVSHGSLTIYSTAEIKGSFTAARLIIPAGNHFAWPGRISVISAQISGELSADLRAEDTVVIESTARLFGAVEAKSLVIREGAVVVGKLRIGPPKAGP